MSKRIERDSRVEKIKRHAATELEMEVGLQEEEIHDLELKIAEKRDYITICKEKQRKISNDDGIVIIYEDGISLDRIYGTNKIVESACDVFVDDDANVYDHVSITAYDGEGYSIAKKRGL